MLALPLGIGLGAACKPGEEVDEDEPVDCVIGQDGATCSAHSDCVNAGGHCNPSTCQCEPGGSNDTESESETYSDESFGYETTTDAIDTTGSWSGTETGAASTGMPPAEDTSGDDPKAYRFFLIEDMSDPQGDPSGCDVDAGQLYDHESDNYAIDAICEFGAGQDPAHSDCSQAIGEKMIGACGPDDTHYVSLGGRGGRMILTMAEAVEEGDIFTLHECGGGPYVSYAVSVGTGTLVDGWWVPLTEELNGSLVVPVLPPPP